MSDRKGGRRRTGTIVNIGTKRSPIYQALITMNDGRRKRLPPLPRGTSEAKARDYAAYWSERAKEAPVPKPKPDRVYQITSDITLTTVCDWYGIEHPRFPKEACLSAAHQLATSTHRIDRYGYVRCGDSSVHRLVMAIAINRPFFAKENVHHVNGNRRDNRIQNLELWSRDQPSGQRVSDKVAWAREIIRKYRGAA